MRLVPIASAGLTVMLVAAGASITAVASNRHSQFMSEAQSLQSQWQTDVAEGVPAASIAPLQSMLQSSMDHRSTWWSPHWWGATGQPLIDSLRHDTQMAWNAAMVSARTRAQAAVDAWNQLNQQLGSFVPASVSGAASAWPAQITAASTPGELERMARTWLTAVSTAHTAAQTAQLNSEVSNFGGVAGLIAEAQHDLAVANGDNLDSGNVADLVSQVQNQFQNGNDASAPMQQLVTATKELEDLIALNNTVGGMIRPIELTADQASAEGTPNASSFQSQYSSLQSSYYGARTTAQLTALQGQLNTLQSGINAELAANVCGHNVGSGKVITINLTLQEGVFYQDGCVVRATPVTTGRPQLRTPTGNFSIFYKKSPFEFFSPWPMGSPFYYPPTWTSWVMEFADGGYFIHDAWWEPSYEYGPGGEDSAGASHGCIHIPTDVMQWLYGWTPNGTPVIITA